MPEDKFLKLYSYLKENQLTDLDESTFKSIYSDINRTKEIHSYLKSQGMTDLDLTSFHSSYFGGQVKKKKKLLHLLQVQGKSLFNRLQAFRKSKSLRNLLALKRTRGTVAQYTRATQVRA